MSEIPARGHLPRLSPEYYRGFTFVHWVMAIEARATGWLTPLFHSRFREAMMHAIVRYELMCPVYCLMPDHLHVIWIGCAPQSDQKVAATFFRRTTNLLLSPNKWQREPFDHVLREEERNCGAFQATCQYVLENPVRKNLSVQWKEYAFSGAVLPGFPDLDPRRGDFWEVFWKIYNRKLEGGGNGNRAVTGTATEKDTAS